MKGSSWNCAGGTGTEPGCGCRALGSSQILEEHEASQNLEEMLRGREQHREFPRGQAAQGQSSQMEAVSVSEGIAAAGKRAGEKLAEKRGGRGD